ncbi:helix-turn-helix domain-containing protein [Mycobacteroides franklinii]|uniref:hypothetical protein n=1 Tax=Mycobacteroides franklinii TaxID=948102 RepID=UPI001041EA60|nr:hypothetical protein [Mycobacteroides franklinii]
MTEETVVIEPPLGQLLVIVGDDTHTFHPSAQSLVVGIGDNGSIQIAPDSLPGAHVVLSKTGAYWTGVVAGREVLVDGQLRASFSVVEPVTCRFPGQEQSVTFLTESHRRGQTTELDPGVLREARAAAQLSDQEDATLPGLADASTMDPGASTRLEEHELWPGDDLLAKLERAYGWPVGTLSRIRDGRTRTEGPDDNDATSLVASTGQVPLLANAAQLALQAILPRIDTLPGADSADLPARANAITDDLRRVEELCQRAAQHSHGIPEFARILSNVRRAYRKVMLLAAQSSGAYLSQRLYATRYLSGLTAEEMATAAAIPIDAVTAAEAGTDVAPADEVALTHLLNHLAN